MHLIMDFVVKLKQILSKTRKSKISSVLLILMGLVRLPVFKHLCIIDLYMVLLNQSAIRNCTLINIRRSTLQQIPRKYTLMLVSHIILLQPVSTKSVLVY